MGEALALTEVAPYEVFEGAPHSQEPQQPQQGPNIVCVPQVPRRVRDLPASAIQTESLLPCPHALTVLTQCIF